MPDLSIRRRRRLRPTDSAVGCRSEALEQRKLLATVSGVVWGDMDSNEVRGFFEDGIPELTVFIDSNENGAFDDGEPFRITDAKGRYSFKNLAVGTYYVGLVMPDGFGQTTPGIVGRVPSGFDIEVVFPDNSLTQEQKDVFTTAAQKWESVLAGDLPDVILPGGTVVDDIRIFATAPAIDGPGGILGQANFTEQRSAADGALPYEGFMQFDAADLAALLADQQLDEVIVHEMGHVLGVGTIWYGTGGAPVVAIGQGSPGVTYIGPRGNLESNRLIGRNAVIETGGGGGTAFAHWSEATYGNELMSGFLNPGENPLSRLTVGNMEDMGYEVNFLGVDTYLGIGPLPEDLDNAFVDLARIPFEIGLRLKTDAEIFDQANFGIRPNVKPSPFFFTVGPVIQTPGEDVRLLAEIDTTTLPTFTGDVDFRDRIIQVNFYAESNGVPGLQTGVDGDKLLIEDLDGTDGWETTVDTTGQALGEQIYYARAFDRLYWTQDRAVGVDFVPLQTQPARPESLRGIGLNRQSIQLNWIDTSVNENGFLLETSRSPNFDVPEDITKTYLPPQDGTGPYTYEQHVPEGELTTRYYRVRSFNTGGSSLFSDRVTVRTLSRLELLIDNETEGGRVRNIGNWETVVDRDAATNLTYLRGNSGFVEYDPRRTTTTEYFVFLTNPNISDPGRILVTVFHKGMEVDELTGEEIPFTVEIDQAASSGAEVLLGRFHFGTGSFVRIQHLSGVARADTVRFLPVS